MKKSALITLILVVCLSLFVLISCSDSNDTKVTILPNASKNTFCVSALEKSSVQIITPLWFDMREDNLPVLYYSKTGSNWEQYKFYVGLNGGFSGEIIKLNKDEKVYIVGTSKTFSYSNSAFLKFNMTGTVEVSGSLSDLLEYKTGAVKALGDSTSDLPANVFSSLFDSCSSLKNASKLELPSGDLSEGCFKGMFSGCENMAKAPVLKADSLSAHCFDGMFSGCKKLETLEVLFDDWGETSISDLLSGVTQNLVFSCPDDLSTEGAKENISVMDTEEYSSSYKRFGFVAKEANSTVSLNKKGTGLSELSLEYKVGDTATVWTTYSWNENTGAVITLDNVDDVVYFRATSSNPLFSKDADNYYYFSVTGKVAPTGNLLCLLENSGEVLSIPNYVFNHLFVDCKGLTEVPAMTFSSVTEGCYLAMFSGCTSITETPELKATSLAKACYKEMFKGCTSITTVSAISATSVKESSCESMFSGCTSITETPELKATSLGKNSYLTMFSGCTSLETVSTISATSAGESSCESMFSGCIALETSPALPATALAESCYESMFSGCTSLETASTISATSAGISSCESMFSGCIALETVPNLSIATLGKQSCKSMFSGCIALETAPALPATTLAESCYESMFSGCTNLTTAPKLSATTLAKTCYKQMFKDCTSLKKLEVGFTNWNATNNSTQDWLSGVETSGLILGPNGFEIGNNSASTVPESWDKIENFLLFTATTSDVTVKLVKEGSPTQIYLEYIDESGKHDYTPANSSSVASITVPTGKSVYLKAKLTSPKSFSSSSSNYYHFVISGGPVAVSGNIMYLIDSKGIETTLPSDYAFYKLFYGCTTLTAGPDLPSKKLKTSCYESMFQNCTSLLASPTISADTLASSCCKNMFNGCTSLTTATTISVTAAAANCYESMFQGCTALKKSPALPAETLYDNCYLCMFSGCSSLETAGSIGAKTLAATACKQMFMNCISLKVAPTLNASKPASNGYYQMFKGCISLTSCVINTVYSDSDSSNKTCFNYMFQNCSSFNSLTVAFTGFNTFSSWMSGVASEGTFKCPKSLITASSFTAKIKSIVNGIVSNKSTNVNAIPNGWKIETY